MSEEITSPQMTSPSCRLAALELLAREREKP
jgi:hypothetical protein